LSRRPSERLRVDDIDVDAVRMALEGVPLRLNRGERRLSIHVLASKGMTSGAIAAHLGLTVRMVRREREVLGIAAPPHVHRAA
jgi:hypothetical protein